MGVQHPGYEASASTPANPPPASNPNPLRGSLARPRSRDSIESRGSSITGAFSPSPSTPALLSASPSRGKGLLSSAPPAADSPAWPAAFYEDFTSRIWLTYRSEFAPIRDGRLSDLDAPLSLAELTNISSIQIQNPQLHHHQHASSTSTVESNSSASQGAGNEPTNPWWDRTSQMSVSISPPKQRWVWGEKVWAKDTGWGCMLRTGQSLLAQALIHLHLSRGR